MALPSSAINDTELKAWPRPRVLSGLERHTIVLLREVTRECLDHVVRGLFTEPLWMHKSAERNDYHWALNVSTSPVLRPLTVRQRAQCPPRPQLPSYPHRTLPLCPTSFPTGADCPLPGGR